MANLRVGVIGGGQMGTALVKGILRSGLTTPDIVMVADVLEAARERIREETGARTTAQAADVLPGADIIIIAVKPQMMDGALSPLRGKCAARQTVLSIMAGVTTERIEAALSGGASPVHLVRAMPNTPALIGAGMAAICKGTNAADLDMDRAELILSAVGKVLRVDEKQMDAVTGLSGSGPGYVYVMIEALADGGVKVGLPKPLALTLAAQTVLGAARMVIETAEHPAVLRDRVTSPGGTTIAGLHAMEANGLRNALMSGVEAATKRSRELGG